VERTLRSVVRDDLGGTISEFRGELVANVFFQLTKTENGCLIKQQPDLHGDLGNAVGRKVMGVRLSFNTVQTAVGVRIQEQDANANVGLRPELGDTKRLRNRVIVTHRNNLLLT